MKPFKLIIKVNKGAIILSVNCINRIDIKSTYLSIMRKGITTNSGQHFSKDDIWNICCPQIIPKHSYYYSKIFNKLP